MSVHGVRHLSDGLFATRFSLRGFKYDLLKEFFLRQARNSVSNSTIRNTDREHKSSIVKDISFAVL